MTRNGRPGAVATPDSLDTLVRGRRIIVCCGTGGVGKTTIAAAVALAGARAGRTTALVTIDPARRLADALGLESLANDPRPVPLDGASGQLWACMLDAKATFDDVVRRHAPTPERAERILANSFYRNVSGSLGGTQEYMATEKLYVLVNGEHADVPPFDLVVVDTPPTRNALDFLTAPRRLTRLLDNRVFRIMMTPSRIGLRVVTAATDVLLRSVGKVLGAEVIADAVAFFQAFEGMEAGFRDRSQHILALLHDNATGWVVVTSPRPEAVAEAMYFTERLAESGISVAGLVANRSTPRFGPVPTLPTNVAPESVIAALVADATVLAERADREDLVVAPLAARIGGPVVRISDQGNDVHDLDALAAIGAQLVSDAAGPVPRPARTSGASGGSGGSGASRTKVPRRAASR